MTSTRTEAVALLIDLANQMEIQDNIDWRLLNIKEADAYELMANSVVDQFNSVNPEYHHTVMMATIVKLLVENFVLNLRIRGQG